MKKIVLILALTILLNPVLYIRAQTNPNIVSFSEVKMLVPNGNDIDEKSVIVTFLKDSMTISSKSNLIDKIFLYSDIKGAEYSYSKNPRWKTGLGLGAASFFLFPPLLFVAIPLGFTKHRRHWVTIKTADNFAVLKLSKSNRKIFMPTFETKTGITVEAIGEDK